MIDLVGFLTDLVQNLRHRLGFVGNTWYVDGDITTSGNGFTPRRAFKTITEAIAAMAAGDAVKVKAGTYDEDGLDLNLVGLELHAEIGTLIVNTSAGTCLTLSGNSCLTTGLKVAQAGQVGFAVTGAGCFLDHCIAEGCTVAFDVDGEENTLEFCQDNDATVTGFDVASPSNVLYLCKSIAAGGASRGYYLSHTNAHKNMLYQCLSLGNGTAGFETVAGADLNAFAFCTSGGGDGARVDAGSNNTWPSFAFENALHTVQTFAGGGGGSKNLFRVYGIVEIQFIYGHVTTNLNADVDNLSLDVFPAGGALVALATLVDSASAPSGSLLLKMTAAANPLVLKSAAVPFIAEPADWRSPFVSSIVGAQGDGTATYIRCTYSGVATSGVIHWHIEWKPLSGDGFVESV